MKRWLLVALLAGGCAGTADSVTVTSLQPRVHPIYQYRGYGEYLPDRDAVVLAKGKSGGLDASPVKFLQETLPEGIEMNGPVLGVKDGYHHKLIGKLAYSNGKLESKLDLIARVKQVVAAAGGDAAMGVFLLTDEKDYNSRRKAWRR